MHILNGSVYSYAHMATPPTPTKALLGCTTDPEAHNVKADYLLKLYTGDSNRSRNALRCSAKATCSKNHPNGIDGERDRCV
jgi:hypothetical protein